MKTNEEGHESGPRFSLEVASGMNPIGTMGSVVVVVAGVSCRKMWSTSKSKDGNQGIMIV